eukprot:COSAG01_NODE_10163_length_2232_cov_79.620722_2_plen_121_part_00
MPGAAADTTPMAPAARLLLDPIRRDATRDAAAGPDHRLTSQLLYVSDVSAQPLALGLVWSDRTADAMPMQRLQMLLARLRIETHLMQTDVSLRWASLIMASSDFRHDFMISGMVSGNTAA